MPFDEERTSSTKRVVVVGGGFGGLAFCRKFKAEGAQVVLVDKRNYHLFQPLLYQVATAGLSAPAIAQPIRSLVRGENSIIPVMEEVTAVDLANRQVRCGQRRIEYDYLVLAAGMQVNYFGNDEWARYAPGLKTLDDARHVRNQVLDAFERAETTNNDKERERLMTIVVVGAGPTGVELAGALAELARHVLRKDFRRINPAKARVIIAEGLTVLPGFADSLADSAREQLQELGVEVIENTMVSSIEAGRVVLDDDSVIESENVIWTAGVSAVSFIAEMDAGHGKQGRLKVEPDYSLAGHPEVFAIGDIAELEDVNGKMVPGVAPAAMQAGKFVAGIVSDELSRGEEPGSGERPRFAYRDKGYMTTIGRAKAVAQVGSFEFSGYFAWLAWLFVHLVTLMDMRSKLLVLIHWAYAYFTYSNGARIIWGRMRNREDEARGPLEKIKVVEENATSQT